MNKKNIFLEWGDKKIYNPNNHHIDSTELVIGLWGSISMPSVLLPSYIIWWIEMLSERNKKLKIFIASNLAAIINWWSINQAQEVWVKTKEFLEWFISEFYSSSEGGVTIAVDTQLQAESTLEKANQFVGLYWAFILKTLDHTIVDSLQSKYKKYVSSAWEFSHEFLQYPFCHPLYEWMVSEEENNIIKLGWRWEQLFNSISSHLLSHINPSSKWIILQRTMKTWKAPLYYSMRWETQLWDNIPMFKEIENNAPMREFDIAILQDRIWENTFKERYRDTQLT